MLLRFVLVRIAGRITRTYILSAVYIRTTQRIMRRRLVDAARIKHLRAIPKGNIPVRYYREMMNMCTIRC